MIFMAAAGVAVAVVVIVPTPVRRRQGVGARFFGDGVAGGGVAVGVGHGGGGIEYAAGAGAGFDAAIAEIDGGADIELSAIWVGDMDLDGCGQSGADDRSLCTASSKGGYIEQP